MYNCTFRYHLSCKYLYTKVTLLELYFSAKGTVNVNCDISNEPYNQTINDDFKLVVKFGNEYNDENEDI